MKTDEYQGQPSHLKRHKDNKSEKIPENKWKKVKHRR
jgi:hypothetical protein